MSKNSSRGISKRETSVLPNNLVWTALWMFKFHQFSSETERKPKWEYWQTPTTIPVTIKAVKVNISIRLVTVNSRDVPIQIINIAYQGSSKCIVNTDIGRTLREMFWKNGSLWIKIIVAKKSAATGILASAAHQIPNKIFIHPESPNFQLEFNFWNEKAYGTTKSQIFNTLRSARHLEQRTFLNDIVSIPLSCCRLQPILAIAFRYWSINHLISYRDPIVTKNSYRYTSYSIIS